MLHYIMWRENLIFGFGGFVAAWAFVPWQEALTMGVSMFSVWVVLDCLVFFLMLWIWRKS